MESDGVRWRSDGVGQNWGTLVKSRGLSVAWRVPIVVATVYHVLKTQLLKTVGRNSIWGHLSECEGNKKCTTVKCF